MAYHILIRYEIQLYLTLVDIVNPPYQKLYLRWQRRSISIQLIFKLQR